MNPEDRIRMLMQTLATGMVESPMAYSQQAPEMFSDSIPSVADINTPVYQSDAEYPGGSKGYTLTPPAGKPKRGSAASIAAAHQMRRSKAGYR